MKARRQLTFALCWAGIYTLAFNLANMVLASASVVEMGIAFGWVFLLFLVSTYSRIFFFAAIPAVFLTSAAAAYAEWLMKVPIPRDVVVSAFQSNWQEINGVAGAALGGWIAGASLLSVFCAWHLLRLKLKHRWQTKLVVTAGFLAVFWLCAEKMFPPVYGNIFRWQHPYDVLEYSTNFFREALAIAKQGRKYDLSSVTGTKKKPVGEAPLHIAVIIGEAARPDHFGVYGYARDTTPHLRKEKNLLLFTDVGSCGTTTAVSVPCLMTRATRTNSAPARNETSFISIFKSQEFTTFWISEQAKFNGINTLIAVISNEAETAVFQDNSLTLKIDEFKDHYVHDLRASSNETLAVFHMAGSHFPYHQRYSDAFRHFSPTCPDVLPDACPHDALINSYDNTIVFTDHFLAQVIDALRDKNALMVYVSDHGEYLGERGRFLHGQETEDDELRKVPMIWWVSDVFIRLHPDKVRAMHSGLHDRLSHDHVFHSVLDCAGIESPVIDKALSICRRGSSREEAADP
ncbi:MAG: phosphoethanolamine transferase [Gammaproteobacteria bacterium]